MDSQRPLKQQSPDDSSQLCDECAALRARVNKLEEEKARLEKALEDEFRRRIEEDFGVPYEEVVAHPERFAFTLDDLLKELNEVDASRD